MCPKTNSKNSACPWKFFKGRIIWGGGQSLWAFLVAYMVKNLPAIWETWVQSLGWEDALKRNGYPLQYSCLENSMDRGAWQATVHAVAKRHDWETFRVYHLPLFADFLLVGWWLGTKVVFQEACAQPKVSIPRVGGGLSSYRRTQRYCYVYFLRRRQNPVPWLHHFFLRFVFAFFFNWSIVDLQCHVSFSYIKLYTHTHTHKWASLVAQMVKNLPAMRETWVWSLGWEGPLDEGMATHSIILA